MPQSSFTQMNEDLRVEFAKRSGCYDKAVALFILWANASAARISDASNLQDLLEDEFHFQCRQFLIPLEHSQDAIREQIQSMLEISSGERKLCLLYYAGGGRKDRDTVLWRPDEQMEPAFDWFDLQKMLTQHQLDKILILDCDYGVIPSLNRDGEGQSQFYPTSISKVNATMGKFEILAAPSNMDAKHDSFTAALTKTLKATKGRSLSLSVVSVKLYTTLERAYKPYYINLSRGADRSSIVLTRDASQLVHVNVAINRLTHELNASDHLALKEWAKRAPVKVTGVQFDDNFKNTSDAAFELTYRIDDLEAPHGEDLTTWIGKHAPTIVKSVEFTSKANGMPGQGSDSSERAQPGKLDIEAYVKRLNQSTDTNGVLSTRDGYYNRIRVLPFKWDRDGFDKHNDLREELEDLLNIFRTSFTCYVDEVFEIPASAKASGKVMYKIASLSEGEEALGSKDLVIIIYTGHGKDTSNQGGQCIWCGADEATLNWTHIQVVLDNADFDVAQILDCCYAGTAAKAPPTGKNEILAATNSIGQALTGNHSYMKLLTRALERLVEKHEMFCLEDLHNAIHSDVKTINGERGPKGISLIPEPIRKCEGGGSIRLRPHARSPNDLIQLSKEGAEPSEYVYARFLVSAEDVRSNEPQWYNCRGLEFSAKAEFGETIRK